MAERKSKEQPGSADGEINKELKALFCRKGRAIVENEDKNLRARLRRLETAERVLEFFVGRGLADATPVGEALGFLDESLKGDNSSLSGRGASLKKDIATARSVLIDMLDSGVSWQDDIGAARAILKKSKEETAAYLPNAARREIGTGGLGPEDYNPSKEEIEKVLGSIEEKFGEKVEKPDWEVIAEQLREGWDLVDIVTGAAKVSASERTERVRIIERGKRFFVFEKQD